MSGQSNTKGSIMKIITALLALSVIVSCGLPEQPVSLNPDVGSIVAHHGGPHPGEAFGQAGINDTDRHWDPVHGDVVVKGPRSTDNIGTARSALISATELTEAMGAYGWPPGSYADSPDAGTVNATMVCTDESAGGVNGCTATSTHTCDYCLRRLSMYDQASVEYNDTNDTNQPICLPGTCGTDPWNQQPSAASNVDWFYGDNASSSPAFGGMASMHNWWGSFYPSPNQTPQLWVNVETFGSGDCGGAGLYTSFDHKICLAYYGNATNSSYVMSHEYGHFIHDTYGIWGTSSLREGWADQNTLRWTVYMGPAGMNLWSPSYAMSLPNPGSGFVAQHGDKLVNQEHALSEVVSGTAGSFFFPAAGCTGDSAPYQCGSVLSLVYWELVWNTCQVSYNGCAAGGQIIANTGVYGSSTPWVLANATFAHAIADTSGNSSADPGSFLQDVDAWYSNYVASGYLTSADYANVETVLAHHCVGSGTTNHCADFKLPGSSLPAAYTTKGTLFKEAELGSLSGHFTTTNCSNCASNNKYEKLTYSSFSPGTVTFSSVSLAPGTYQLVVDAHQSVSGGTATMSYRWDNGSWQTAVSIPYNGGSWQWITTPNTLVVSTQGNHSFAIRAASSGTINVDVAVLNKQ